MIKLLTAAMISTMHMLMDSVSGSPSRNIPIMIAVSGSKAPKIATLAEDVKRIALTNAKLLMVVGISPSKISDRQASQLSNL